jgi:hypothetical protein
MPLSVGRLWDSGCEVAVGETGCFVEDLVDHCLDVIERDDVKGGDRRVVLPRRLNLRNPNVVAVGDDDGLAFVRRELAGGLDQPSEKLRG